MKALERGHRLHQELAKRKTPLSMMAICDLFEGCSESTSKRSIRDLKALGAPIYCTEGLGYSYDKHIAFELPSVWFSHEELQALLAIQKLTSHLSGGFFDESTHMIRQKAGNLLGEYMQSPQNMQRIRILATGSRAKSLPMFPTVASAVVEQKCLLIQYENRHAQKTSEREVSPQRLVYYKGNWYLDVWCHQADDFRSFAVEKIKAANFIHKPCKNIPEKDLDLHFSTSFGIFAGEPIAEAVLHFSAKVAAWVQDEEWFPGLLGKDLDNGGYELRIPYHNPTELVMEICRYGADVKVIEPLELQKQVVGVLQKSIAQYL